MEYKKKNPGGRPTKYREEMCDKAVEMMKEGCSKTEVCADLDIHYDTFLCWQNPEDPCYKPEFSDAIKKGEKLSHAWWEKQGRIALREKDFNHALWYMNMKNRHKWTDRQDHTTNDKDISTAVHIYLPQEEEDEEEVH